MFGRNRAAEEPRAKADNSICLPQTLPSGFSDTGETGPSLDGRGLPREGECPTETGDAKDCLPSARRGSREGTLCSDEGSEGNEPELPNAKLPLQPPDS